MDIERIKQNLRFRSGRLSKKSKDSKKQQSSTHTEEQAPRKSTATDRLQTANSDNFIPPLPTWDQTTVLSTSEHNVKQTEQRLSHDESPLPYHATSPLPSLPDGTVNGTTYNIVTSNYLNQNPDPVSYRAETSAQRPTTPSQKSLRRARPFPFADRSLGEQSAMERRRTAEADQIRPISNGMGVDVEKRERPQQDRTKTDPSPVTSSGDDADDFNLRPPPFKERPASIDTLSEHLFSHGHLDTILHDSILFPRFTAFLARYRPNISPVLIRYLETQKAIKAIEYANAVAEGISPLPDDPSPKSDHSAAQLDAVFAGKNKRAYEVLVIEALPAYVTYSLVKVTTECMINEIIGRSTPVMKDLVGGLSEVFCLTDPTLEDNPM